MRRPVGLSAVILLLIAANVYGGMNVALNWEVFLTSYPELSNGALAFILVVIVYTVLGLTATWSWKRWGAVFVTLGYFMALGFDLYFGIEHHPYIATAGIVLYWIALWPVKGRLM